MPARHAAPEVTRPAGHPAGGNDPVAAAVTEVVPPAAGPGRATTTVVVRAPEIDAVPESRRRFAGSQRDEVLSLVGAAAGAVGFTALLYTWLLPFDGVLGFIVIAYVSFLILYAILISADRTGLAVRDKFVNVIVHSLGFLLLAVLVTIVVFTFVRGWRALVHGNFFTQDLSVTGPLAPMTQGGVLHAIIGTLEQISMALIVTVPLGVSCAVFLNEIPGRFSRFVRTVVEAMTALPSIVSGLFIFAIILLFASTGLKERIPFERSGFAASLAISVMMLPIIVRAGDVVLRLVPGTLREASLALGASQWRTAWHVVLPTARSGLTTAVILGTARGIGETSPVLLTAGVSTSVNLNPFSGPQVSLPLQIFELVRYPGETMIARGFATATVLLMLVMLLFVLARLIGGRGAGQLSAAQLRRRMRASRADQARFVAREREAAVQVVPDHQPQ
ncbi:phosphate ABC transporter permease PstA [Dactylosporangium sp. NBC_01737]|uniref:phosphate ABC transporter permease PstA n=1 Tax=Dactylosporangium sp. NBC_01737 TaxID=2975959 RepID=UPI002E142C8B|nr:phosphate ABC transporter permease PstA [Dactylosporangium sp. NBC_01737]